MAFSRYRSLLQAVWDAHRRHVTILRRVPVSQLMHVKRDAQSSRPSPDDWSTPGQPLPRRLRDRGAHKGHCRLYFQARLPLQFDEYIWFEQTAAVTPLDTKDLGGLPDTYPFGL